VYTYKFAREIFSVDFCFGVVPASALMGRMLTNKFDCQHLRLTDSKH
jgi:hypothetical protein